MQLCGRAMGQLSKREISNLKNLKRVRARHCQRRTKLRSKLDYINDQIDLIDIEIYNIEQGQLALGEGDL